MEMTIRILILMILFTMFSSFSNLKEMTLSDGHFFVSFLFFPRHTINRLAQRFQ